MSEPLIVWVVTSGCYSSQGISGVYATAEAAMANQSQMVRGVWVAGQGEYVKVPVKWRHNAEHGDWSNNGDWEDAITIEPYEVKGA